MWAMLATSLSRVLKSLILTFTQFISLQKKLCGSTKLELNAVRVFVASPNVFTKNLCTSLKNKKFFALLNCTIMALFKHV